MRHPSIVFGIITLCLTAVTACSRDSATAGAAAPAKVTIDHAALPARYAAPLPSDVAGMKAWGEEDAALPPSAHVVDLLLAGDPTMLQALEHAAAAVSQGEAAGWVNAWRGMMRYRTASPAYCTAVRPIMAGKAPVLRNALAGAYAATCHDPQDLAQSLDPDMPYWVVIEAYQSEFSDYPPPAQVQPLLRAARQAADAGDEDERWRSIWTLAVRPEPEARTLLRALQAEVTDRDRADQLAMAFFRTDDPELHAIARRACATMQRPHTMCEFGPRPAQPFDGLESSPAEVAAMRKRLVGLGFTHVQDAALTSLHSADATAMLTQAGHVHGFDAETGMFPNAHDSVLRALAPLVQPALSGAVFEEKYPADDDGPYHLTAYLNGKRYQVVAQNLGDWYDLGAMLDLLNTMLADQGRVERFASLHTEDQIAWVVGAPQPAIDAAFAAGVLQPDGGYGAEANGKAFEEEVIRHLKQ